MIEAIYIGIALLAAIVFWFLTGRNERSWDTPSRPITPTPKKETSSENRASAGFQPADGNGFVHRRRNERNPRFSAEDLTRCDRIVDYLDTVDTQVQQSDRSDKAEIREMIFKLKNRWKIIYRYIRPSSVTGRRLPPHPKVMRAAADRDNLEVKLMDKGIDLKYPD